VSRVELSHAGANRLLVPTVLDSAMMDPFFDASSSRDSKVGLKSTRTDWTLVREEARCEGRLDLFVRSEVLAHIGQRCFQLEY
jgi:hypothetical protein